MRTLPSGNPAGQFDGRQLVVLPLCAGAPTGQRRTAQTVHLGSRRGELVRADIRLVLAPGGLEPVERVEELAPGAGEIVRRPPERLTAPRPASLDVGNGSAVEIGARGEPCLCDLGRLAERRQPFPQYPLELEDLRGFPGRLPHTPIVAVSAQGAR
ncbi:hypothetical protein [Actinophytocola xanthii]|uniref:hypothetical protein n=1 Tax=Actinophytocola xanthii TaxID=1912961 RepID=UPI0018E96DD2|nr:hypothetical protein [Actinophytocola xanthii]